MAGSDAAPAGRLRRPALGRPRDPIGGHYDPPRGARWTGTVPPVSDGPRCDKPMRRTGTKALRRNRGGNQETRTWGSEIAAVECREAPASFKRGCGKTEDWCATRCSIPSHVEGQEKGPANGAGRTAYPGPPRIRAISLVSLIPPRKRGRDKKERRVALAAAFWLYPRAFPVGVKRPQSGHPRRSCAGGSVFPACHINRS